MDKILVYKYNNVSFSNVSVYNVTSIVDIPLIGKQLFHFTIEGHELIDMSNDKK